MKKGIFTGERGDDMKVGFIGAGKAGCSLGQYFTTKTGQTDVQVTGYYSLIEEDARWAAAVTKSECYKSVEEVIAASDSVILSTPDGAIKKVWESINKEKMAGKIICHLSGSLSSDVFSGVEECGGYPVSIHPMFAFSNKESVFQQLNQVSFTLEGHAFAVSKWKELFRSLGNAALEISKEVKPKYHAAASLLSNHVVAVLEAGYQLLQDCGFSEEEARSFSSVLVRDNVEHVISDGGAAALTGPIERGDMETVEKHLKVLNDGQKAIYQACGQQLIQIARKKNEERDYSPIEKLWRI